MKSQFLLDKSITFLNHGSFGACPKPIFEEYQRLQLELENEPVYFILKKQAEYLESLPLHESQQILETKNNEVLIGLELFLTDDFISEILSMSRSVTIIEPNKFKEKENFYIFCGKYFSFISSKNECVLLNKTGNVSSPSTTLSE